MPGPDGSPTATIASEIDVLGWPLWIAYLGVFALTLVIGGRLASRCHRAGRDRHQAQARASPDGRRSGRQIAKWAHTHGPTRMGPRASWGLGTGHGLRILDVEEPLAYCLPGVRSRVVVSEGTLTALADNEIDRDPVARARAFAGPT